MKIDALVDEFLTYLDNNFYHYQEYQEQEQEQEQEFDQEKE